MKLEYQVDFFFNFTWALLLFVGAFFGRFFLPILLMVVGMLVIKFIKNDNSSVNQLRVKVSASELINVPSQPAAVINKSQRESGHCIVLLHQSVTVCHIEYRCDQ